MLRYSRGVVRFDQSVRSSTHARSGMRPWRASQASTKSIVSRKSGFSALSADTSITQAAAMKFSAGIESTALSG